MYRFKKFLSTEAMNPFADKNPIGGGGMGGGGLALPKAARPSRMAPALRYGGDVVAGKPGGAHSDLIPQVKDKGKPDEMGFVRKHSGDTDEGPYKGRFFDREKASILGKRNPNLLNDPDQANDKPWQAQSYDFKPESGKKPKKLKESLIEFLESKDKNNKKKPTKNKQKKKECGFVANKEAQHGGMSYYSPGEL